MTGAPMRGTADSLPDEWVGEAAIIEWETHLAWRRVVDPAYEADPTERGRRLRAARRRVVESGEPLLGLEEILQLLGRNVD